ncbi:MAG: hypothetical protein HKN85_04120 [Gammaproteobacteria bacterium]|nr:hypothetical protein [Gammaproteobacteria bacterium]
MKQFGEWGIWVAGGADESATKVYEPDRQLHNRHGRGRKGAVPVNPGKLRADGHDPMAGSVSSLDVSVGTGVILFEAVRQRRESADYNRQPVASDAIEFDQILYK